MITKQSKDFESPPSLRHLKRLTSNVGIIQHADHEVPDPAHGYSIDDNARAIIACLWYFKNYQDESVLRLVDLYFSYIAKVEKEGGSFHNFLSYSEKILDSEGSEDSIGRAIWALGEIIKHDPRPEIKEKANQILDRASIDKHLDHAHIRTKAYILLGLLSAKRTDQAKNWLAKLIEIFEQNSSEDWQWFEDGLFYANGIIPYALSRAASELKNHKAEEIAKKSFDWLESVSRDGSTPSPIGQNGWFFRNGVKAEYDQQPLEAADMVIAAMSLAELSETNNYKDVALEWINWYFGNNIRGETLVNEETSGVYDALTPGGTNKNQGAESIVTYLMAYLALNDVR